MDEGKWERWRRALLETRALVVAGAAVLTALAVPAGDLARVLLLAAGLVVYAIVVAGNYRDQAARGYEVPEPDLSGLGPRYRDVARAGVNVQRRILGALQSAPPYLRQALGDLVPQVRALGSKQVEMARRLQELEDFLRPVDEQALLRERQRLAAQAAGHADAFVRQQMESALCALDGRLESLHALATQADRLTAQIQNVQQTLETMHTRIVRLAAVDGDVSGGEATFLNQQLGGLNAEVDALSRSAADVFAAARERS